MDAHREAYALWLALGGYFVAGVLAMTGVLFRRFPERGVAVFLWSGLLVHAVGLVWRWQRLGHGPFISQHEILSSNLWSLLLFFALVYARFRPVRPMAAVALPPMFIMMGWLLMVQPGDTLLPSSYDTLWLYAHVLLGKVFLGAAMTATVLGGVVLLRGWGVGARLFDRLPADASLDDLAYRFLVLALIFDTLMLVAGAIWAQDAWGRYWSWDPLEVWSLANWLLTAMALHARPLLGLSPRGGAWVSLAVFVVAYLNFFGVPFLAVAPHRGVV